MGESCAMLSNLFGGKLKIFGMIKVIFRYYLIVIIAGNILII